MPTILRVGPNRFFFYASDRAEPVHVHVEGGDGTRFVLSVLGPLRGESGGSMRKRKRIRSNELHPEYDFSSMKGGVRGKYAARLGKESNLVLLEPDVASAFPTRRLPTRPFNSPGRFVEDFPCPRSGSPR